MKTYCTKCGHPTTQKADNLLICEQGHENWINAVSGPTLCILKNGKLLFGVRGHEPYAGKLDLPGGFLDLNESLEEAAVREAKEELNAAIEIVDYLGSYTSFYIGNTKPVINIAFIVKPRGELQPGDDLAGGELVWRSLDDLPTETELSWPWPTKMYPDLQKWYETYGPL